VIGNFLKRVPVCVFFILLLLLFSGHLLVAFFSELATTTITTKYDGTYADRNVSRSKLFYYWAKDWALFSTALVHFTDVYENKEDLQLMNKNAQMVLEHSTNPVELKAATAWVKHAVDKDPSNTTYRETYTALVAKSE